ncbi:unnamed protein product [Closterium sp. Naga37s-1]|nr:unnamed protein product [Closterium sp. Naga37s-1]
MSIYELHIRDFSASDPSVLDPHRGTYLAFTHPVSAPLPATPRLPHFSPTPHDTRPTRFHALPTTSSLHEPLCLPVAHHSCHCSSSSNPSVAHGNEPSGHGGGGMGAGHAVHPRGRRPAALQVVGPPSSFLYPSHCPFTCVPLPLLLPGPRLLCPARMLVHGRLDWSGGSSNFGVGLPPHEKNGDKWDMMRPLMANQTLRPTSADIAATSRYLRMLLAVRYSSPLFRLPSLELVQLLQVSRGRAFAHPVPHPSTPPLPFPAMPSRALAPSPALPQERVRFLNVGPTALPGVIVMSVADGDAGSGMALLSRNLVPNPLQVSASPSPCLSSSYPPPIVRPLSRMLPLTSPVSEQHGMVPAVQGAGPWFQADTAMLTVPPLAALALVEMRE